MKTALAVFLSITTSAGLIGCAPAEDSGTEPDAARLARFRAAVPTTDKLGAPQVSGTESLALGDPAVFPRESYPLVAGINGSVGLMIGLLRTVVMLPPTVYNSDTNEYVWGPFPSDDGIGYTAAYIQDTGTDEDFRYHFAFLRGASNDLATLTPVIVGGATPDPANQDDGAGVLLWDFEADRAFREANDPGFDPAAPTNRGRFATLFAAGPDENDAANHVGFVVAAFRDFVPEDNPGDPVDLDYFYGRVVAPEHTLDFLDYQAGFDVSEPKDGVAEDVGVRMAFLDEGTGRAEADAIGGSMGANQSAAVVECWDAGINQTFISYELRDGGDVTDSASDGQATDCGLFQATLDDLQIPSLEDVDPDLLAALDHVASTGSFE